MRLLERRPRKRPRWVVVAFVGVQILIPTFLLIIRWTVAGGACLNYGWQMYACG